MASEMVEKKATKASQQERVVPQVEQEDPLPCPRCQSTNTKFCYYNNYNFSQPRHFCKACRRYWTHGGTLRDIPIGGATRKTAKRSRTSSSSSSSSSPSSSTSVFGSSLPIVVSETTHPHVAAAASVSFTSLLCNANNAGGFGFGFGFDDVGFGLQFGYGRVNGFDVGGVNGDGGVNREDTWQAGSGALPIGGGDCFSYLPELSISSTHGNGMK